MRLQHKLALYNTFTKITIIAILGILILVFIDRISINHLQRRLIDKRNKLIINLSDTEIASLLNQQSDFTDYNILKEEYIILKVAGSVIPKNTEHIFSKEKRIIDGDEEEYLILADYFSYGGKRYRLEIGETMLVVKQLENTILYFTLLILAISILLSIIADLTFTRIILSPFYRIIDQKLNRVDDPIHFNYLPTKTTTDDFKLLDTSISSLMKKISSQFITQKQFTSNVSHELLTPIAILRTRLENMLNDAGLSENNQAKIISSLKTLNRLKAIVNSLLLISKVENHQFNKTDEISVQMLINDIYEEMEDWFAEKNISFKNNISYNFKFRGNSALLHTLCINLIKNAIKYNKANGQVIINDALDPNVYKLQIADTGIGMDEPQIESALNRFQKFNADDDSYGLGLAISKSIAAFHNIGIDIQSEKGEGTVVTLTFKQPV